MFQREWTIGQPDMIAYAGATWDWHKLHYDADYLAERGLERPVVDGQVFGAYLAIALGEWFPGSVISELAFRFKSLVFAGETIRCVGAVTASSKEIVQPDLRVEIVRPDLRMEILKPDLRVEVVELDLRVEVVDDGRIAVAPASATLRLP